MESNERDRKLDQWLDEALKEYGEAEPRFGLEQRVVTHLHAAERERQRTKWWRWMPAFAAIAAVIVIGVAVRPLWEKNSAGNTKTGQQVAVTPTEPKTVPKEVQTYAANVPAQHDRLTKKDARSRQEARSTSPQRIVDQAEETKPVEVAAVPAAPKEMNEAKGVAGGAAGGVIGGIIAPLPANQSASAMNQVQAPRAERLQTLEVQSGTTRIQVGPVSPEKTKAERRALQVAKSAPAKESGAVSRVDGMDMMMVRTQLSHVPAGPPAQQFPTPSPLTKEEQLMVAAAQRMKEKPPIAEPVASSGISAIKIDNIQIAPLAGPQR